MYKNSCLVIVYLYVSKAAPLQSNTFEFPYHVACAKMPTMDTSYLTAQVTTIIGQLHGLFDDIGVPSHERESREAEVSK